MSSSISTSEPLPFPRKACILFGVWSFALLLAAGLTVRGYTQLRRSKLGLQEGLRQASEHYPATLAALEHPLVVVGSSHVRAGVVPDTFDRVFAEKRGRPIQALALGFNGLASECLVELSKSIRHELEPHPGRDLVLFEFNPLASTRKWLDIPGFQANAESCLVGAARGSFFAHEWLRSPTRAARLLAYRWFTNGGTPRDITTDLRRELFPVPSWWPDQPKPPSPGGRAYAAVTAVSAPNRWVAATRGGRHDQLGDPALAPHVAVLTDPKGHTFSRDRRERMGGIREYRFVPSAIEDHVRGIRELQQAAKQVVLLVTPAEVEVIQESAVGAANRAAAIERIRTAAGICVIDLYSSPLFGDGDFEDVDHLSRAGAETYSRILAERLAAWDAGGRQGCTGL